VALQPRKAAPIFGTTDSGRRLHRVQEGFADRWPPRQLCPAGPEGLLSRIRELPQTQNQHRSGIQRRTRKGHRRPGKCHNPPRRHRRNPAPACAGTCRHLSRQRCQTRASLQTLYRGLDCQPSPDHTVSGMSPDHTVGVPGPIFGWRYQRQRASWGTGVVLALPLDRGGRQAADLKRKHKWPGATVLPPAAPRSIGDGAWIGARATIPPGVTGWCPCQCCGRCRGRPGRSIKHDGSRRPGQIYQVTRQGHRRTNYLAGSLHPKVVRARRCMRSFPRWRASRWKEALSRRLG
jgi:hypothetical protein